MSVGTAVYQVDVEKKVGGETWTNVYYITANNDAESLDRGEAIANIEKALHDADVIFTRVRVRDVHLPKNAPGQYRDLGFIGTGGAAHAMPLFVCQRVLFVQTASRPSVKFLRATFGSAGFATRFTLTGDTVNAVKTIYCDPLKALGYLCDRMGGRFNDIQAQTAIAEHQLRRGSKRKAKPVI